MHLCDVLWTSAGALSFCAGLIWLTVIVLKAEPPKPRL